MLSSPFDSLMIAVKDSDVNRRLPITKVRFLSYNRTMRMRKKKWVAPFLEKEDRYLVEGHYSHDNELPLYVEIGMGMGDFITESASLHPEIFYVGLEKEETCVARTIRKAMDRDLENFKVLLADAGTIDECFDPDSIDLRTIPSAVGGDVKTRHGIITAKSIPAKKYGIVTCEPVVKALEKCPSLVLVKSDKVTYGEMCCVSWQNKSLLKRVIGLSGDIIDMDADGNVFVNGELINEPYVVEKELGRCEIDFPYQVPENKIFILGDQRESSVDSRSSAIGCVGKDQIVGRVLFKFWSKK